MDHYKLVGTVPVKCSLMEWATGFNNSESRRVAHTQVTDKVYVSTVFLGLDHNLSGSGPPLLFETMSFGDSQGYTERYSTFHEAEQGHQRIVDMIKSESTRTF